MSSDVLDGVWIYRSFYNQAELVGQNKEKLFKLMLGEGSVKMKPGKDGNFTAVLDMGAGYVMDLYAETIPTSGTHPAVLVITGTGRENTLTDKWVYQYKGYLVPPWAEGVDQPPTLVGTVIRTIPHGTSLPGATGSFIMVKKGTK